MTSLNVLHPSAIAPDVETFRFEGALMAPPIVCTQWAIHEGEGNIKSDVVITRRCEEIINWIFDEEHEQIWFHNGLYDMACMMEWYPKLKRKIWQALTDGRVLDTMWLQRMIQIAKGQVGGPLGLDVVTKLWGVPPPTKEIDATHPDYPGITFDVRTSFGLWYMAEEIPDPWWSYADYDSVATLRLAAHQVAQFCAPHPKHKYPVIRLEDLAFIIRQRYGLYLSRTYGLRVDKVAVSDLARAARGAMARLQEAAIHNGFLKPQPATRAEIAAGRVAPMKFCKAEFEHPPEKPKRKKKDTDEQFEKKLAQYPKKLEAYRKRQEKHEDCQGCAVQALDDHREPSWKLDTKVLKARIIEAYEGEPPLTEPTKQKDGTFSGGGDVSRSRDTLQDSQDAELEAWAEYNEWATLRNKDLPIFENSPVHTHFGMANTFRPTSSGPNILNFRRTGFLIGSCGECGHEMTIDPRQYKKGKDILCEACGK